MYVICKFKIYCLKKKENQLFSHSNLFTRLNKIHVFVYTLHKHNIHIYRDRYILQKVILIHYIILILLPTIL